ncbi:hypothetical protein [Paraburkholderia aromaticivorans]|uniref:hypothetical protein n=1 Tax=Paraburkholderia aromaticivorans TaxID=2026199 RepID=UPI001F10A911|nr:hypothetical protein [Paraburkholderia aromaticivorans]
MPTKLAASRSAGMNREEDVSKEKGGVAALDVGRALAIVGVVAVHPSFQLAFSRASDRIIQGRATRLSRGILAHVDGCFHRRSRGVMNYTCKRS